MGWWSKKIETDEGKVYNVWDSGRGRLDVHQACLIDSFGAKLGSTDNLRDAVDLVEFKTDANVTNIKSR
jgi:hypothetical protein